MTWNDSMLNNIQNAQRDYCKLIRSYRNIVDKKNLTIREIAIMLDEIKCFWLERIEIIEFELSRLSQTNICFLLCGAIYLDIDASEHYFFKSVGDYHLLYDPLLKMESYIRTRSNKSDREKTIAYWRRVYRDTLTIFEEYRNDFYILPIREIVIKDEEKHSKFLQEVTIGVFSNLFNTEIFDEKDFYAKFNNYEEIETNLKNEIRQRIVLSDGDSHLALRSKIDRFFESQINSSILHSKRSEPEIFFVVLFSKIAQIVEILIACSYLNVNPYIRSKLTVHYLLHFIYDFVKDEYIRQMIEKSIVAYIFYHSIERAEFINIPYPHYSNIIKEKKFFPNILAKAHELGHNILHDDLNRLQVIIREEYVTLKQAFYVQLIFLSCESRKVACTK